MHELSIAISMIDMATEEARRQGWTKVNALHLKLGPLSGVVKDALLFSYDVACRGTFLEGSHLVIDEVPVEIYCEDCRVNRIINTIQNMSCPVCGNLSSKIVSGKELEVITMEIEDCPEPAEAMELFQ
jgi:hydrogenase nickel incorporation protein HypA/HybF